MKLTEELRTKILECTADVDRYLDKSSSRQLRVANVETLAQIAEQETLREWFIETYKLLKEIQEALNEAN